MKRFFEATKSDPHLLFCITIVLAYGVMAILGYLDLIPSYQRKVGESYLPPSGAGELLMGTDIFGRSILFKVLAGIKTGMTMAGIVIAIGIPIGLILGTLAGYFGGPVDAFVVWLYSVISSVPYILLIIAASYVLGKGLTAMCAALGLFGWVRLCRLVRAEVLKLKHLDYVEAARVAGAGPARIMIRHIVPGTWHLVIISASLMSLQAIMSEVILTFLGVGIQDGSSWGTMIADASSELVNFVWWPLTSVSFTIFLICYCLNVIGDKTRDILDPRLP